VRIREMSVSAPLISLGTCWTRECFDRVLVAEA
jgi:hypothetical protein